MIFKAGFYSNKAVVDQHLSGADRIKDKVRRGSPGRLREERWEDSCEGIEEGRKKSEQGGKRWVSTQTGVQQEGPLLLLL